MTTGWLILDLDTLCDYSHRVDWRNAGDWDVFHSLAEDDKPNLDVVDFVNVLRTTAAMNVMIVTGRPIKYSKLTQQWLAKHDVYPDVLAMRKNDDWDKDAEMKIAMLEAEFGDRQSVLNSVWIVLDTKEKSCVALRNYGLQVWMPRQGGY